MKTFPTYLCSLFVLVSLGSTQVFASRQESRAFDNGYPSQYLSGSIHYFRVHPSDWRDRLRKLKWAGFHAVQTYVEWSSHEPEPGVYDFSGGLDLLEFITMAEEEGLLVILRPGPYICAERDMGGLPYWLLRLEPDLKLRTSDERFMKYVRRWFDVLLPLLKPYMYENGGPITMVQVENEYGISDACDFEYLTQLAKLLRKGLGDSAFLFSTDNGRTEVLRCDKIPSVYATVDFGPDADIATEFEAQRVINGKGPLINSEFYPGWLDHWGVTHQTKSSEVITAAMNSMLLMNASVNFYVFHGGTNFGLSTGSNLGQKFQACPTSYDYDAPISEAGDLTEKYYAIRDVTMKYFDVPTGPPPPESLKYSYGDFSAFPVASLFDVLPLLPFEIANTPMTFEELSVPNGLVAYQTRLMNTVTLPAKLDLSDTHDRGYVFIDSEYFGLASREEDIYTLPIVALPNQVITIFVESQGRISVGPNLKDFKGLTLPPTINGHELTDWKMTPIPLSNLTHLRSAIERSSISRPIEKGIKIVGEKSRMTLFDVSFTIQEDASHPRDTFLNLDMFTKGYVWVNDFLLGRFWTVMGPQLTLYVPDGILKQGNNTITILELEGTVQGEKSLLVSLVDQPDIDGPVPRQ